MTLLRVAWARYGMRAALVALLKIMVAVVQWRSRHGPAEARGGEPTSSRCHAHGDVRAGPVKTRSSRDGLGRTAGETRDGLGRTAGETRDGLGRTAGPRSITGGEGWHARS
jgi:hypothetical protein